MVTIMPDNNGQQTYEEHIEENLAYAYWILDTSDDPTFIYEAHRSIREALQFGLVVDNEVLVQLLDKIDSKIKPKQSQEDKTKIISHIEFLRSIDENNSSLRQIVKQYHDSLKEGLSEQVYKAFGGSDSFDKHMHLNATELKYKDKELDNVYDSIKNWFN